MTAELTYRKYLKQLVHHGQWEYIGELFGFTPKYLDVPKKKVIDWACVPASFYMLLQKREVEVPWPEGLRSVVRLEIKAVRPPGAARGPEAKVKGYSIRQLEHFGDAIVNLAARYIVARERQGGAYFKASRNLESNQNLATAGYVSGAAAEIEVGVEFVDKGADAAFRKALEILKKTDSYCNNYLNNKINYE